MTESVFWLSVGAYLACGLLALVILDLLTGRIRGRLQDAAQETQTKLVNIGYFTGHKKALVVIILALWVFWPFAIYGAIRKVAPDDEEKDR